MQNIRSSYQPYLILVTPILIWVVLTSLSLTVIPNGWNNLFARAGLYYDAQNYTKIASYGYQTDLLSAFYPLWPAVMRAFSLGQVDNIIKMGWIGSVAAMGLYLVSLFFLVNLLTTLSAKFHKFILAIFILSPLSLFRVLPFTESLFSLLLILLIVDMTFDKGSIVRCGLWAASLSLCRPMFPILAIAAVVIVAYLYVTKQRGIVLKKCFYIFVGAIIGYFPFGFYCLDRYSSFWKPFEIQSEWGKSFGLHWPLLYSPSVINGSQIVLVWDMIGFYVPIVMVLFLPVIFCSKISTHPAKVVYLFCALIGGAHSAIAFLSADKFMSISRHTLANPLPYLGASIAFQTLPSNFHRIARLFLSVFLIFSSCFLCIWWLRFSQDRWIG